MDRRMQINEEWRNDGKRKIEQREDRCKIEGKNGRRKGVRERGRKPSQEINQDMRKEGRKKQGSKGWKDGGMG